MCIIVDANSAHHLTNRTDDGKPVLRWLLDPRRKAGLIVGGKLAVELNLAGLRSTLIELSRAGRLRRVPDDIIRNREALLVAERTCQSNDLHVVALALVTGCQLVFTRDKPLHADLKRLSRGRNRIAIYQTASHSRLLTECVCIEPSR